MEKKNGRPASKKMLLILIAGLIIWNCSGNSTIAAEKSGSELVVNGDMEKGNPPDGWNASGATVRADTDSHSGKQSLRISPLVDLGRVTQHFPVKPDTKYQFEFWYKGTTDVSGLYFYLSAGKVYPAGYYANTGSATTWTRWTGELDTSGVELKPDKTAQLGFCAWPGGDVLIDDVSVTEIKPGEAAAPVVKETPTATKNGTELISNGDMEKGTPPANWNTDRTTLSMDSDYHSGKQSLRISVLANGGWATHNVPVKPDTKYRYEFWYKSTTDVSGLYFYLMTQLWNEPHKTGYHATVLNAETWTRFTGEFNTPGLELLCAGGTVQFGFMPYLGGDVLIDDFSVTEVKPGEAVAPVVKEAPVVVAPAETQDVTNTARAKARQNWLFLFPGYKYICWDKSPWDKLAKVQLPPTAERPGYEFPFQECKEINLAMGENEYESASFVLTNLSDKTAEFSVSAKDGGIPVTIRQALWVTTFNGKEVNDALPLLEGNLSIPSGESREVWLTLYTKGVKPGDYNSRITITSPGLPASSVNLKTKVYPISLPEDKPIYTFYWDYLVPEWITPEVAQALTDDMKKHYVNTPTVHPWPGRLELNSDGTLKKDYRELDKLLGYYRQLNPKMLVFSWNPDAYLMKLPGYPFFSAEWKKLFTSYITGLVSHLKEQGFGYEKFALHPYDEVLDVRVYNMAKLIKEIDPKILIVVNSTASPEEMKNISPYTDIFMPHLYGFLNRPKETRESAVKLLSKSQKFYWNYANPVPPFPQMVSPYSIYRLAVWQAWSEGMGGHGNWIYSYKTHWNAYKHVDGENWAMVYFANADDAPPGLSQKELVVTGKRWEATREGIEDYVYLFLLKDAISKTDSKVSPESLAQAKKILAGSVQTVLEDLKNTTLADKAKEDILKALSKISPAKK